LRVYVAFDPNLNAELVIKSIPKVQLDVASYFSESQLLYKSNHPNVVPIHYACEDNDCIYLAMPYYPRGSLNAVLASRFLTMREVIRYATHFLAGLHNVHSKGLVHFDVKPDNILVRERDDAVLSDFGLAKQANHAGLAEQDRMYLKMLPPERFQQNEYDLRFDIYQAGLTLYRLANGNQVFHGQFASFGDGAGFDRDAFRHAVVNEQFPDRARHLEHIPKKLRTVISTCLKSEPAQRYKSATQIINDLAAIGGADLDWRYELEANGSRCWSKSLAGRNFAYASMSMEELWQRRSAVMALSGASLRFARTVLLVPRSRHS
jgi:serine/threonine protein kinase